MTIYTNQLNTEIIYPDSDGAPMAESDPARDYLVYSVQARRDAIPRLLGLGLSVEQVADALGLSVEEVRRFVQY